MIQRQSSPRFFKWKASSMPSTTVLAPPVIDRINVSKPRIVIGHAISWCKRQKISLSFQIRANWISADPVENAVAGYH